MTIWQPGMRCVCVNAAKSKSLVEGRVYTVLEVMKHEGFSSIAENWSFGIRLVEVAPSEGFEAFCPSRFRPLSETRLDQFRQHLAPQPREKVLA